MKKLFQSNRVYSELMRIWTEACRPVGRQTLATARGSESLNARKGIETIRLLRLEPQPVQMSESLNARKGIETLVISGTPRQGRRKSESLNARKGIETRSSI